MTHEQPTFSSEQMPEESLWDKQKRLTSELEKMIADGASEEKATAKAAEINDNVAQLVEAGEVDDSDAWALSAGLNTSLDDSEQGKYTL